MAISKALSSKVISSISLLSVEGSGSSLVLKLNLRGLDLANREFAVRRAPDFSRLIKVSRCLSSLIESWMA